MASSTKLAPRASIPVTEDPKQARLFAADPTHSDYAQRVAWLRVEGARIARHRCQAIGEYRHLQQLVSFYEPSPRLAKAIARAEEAAASWSAELDELNSQAIALFKGGR